MKNFFKLFLNIMMIMFVLPVAKAIEKAMIHQCLIMSVYDLTDIDKSSVPNPGAGGGIKSVIYAILEDDVDIDSFPSRGDDLVTITADIPLKAGKYIHQIYATEDTIEPLEKLLQGPNRDANSFEITLNFFHPDLAKAIQEFKAKHISSRFFLLFKLCVLDRVYLIGEPCNTAYITLSDATLGKNSKEGRGTNFTFVAQQSLPMAFYEGTLGPLEPDSQS
jgi:hypothetical protein